MCIFLLLCLCNVMRGLSAKPAAENIFTGIENKKKDHLRKLEKFVYPLMSLLVGLSLSTRICGVLQTAQVRTVQLMEAA